MIVERLRLSKFFDKDGNVKTGIGKVVFDDEERKGPETYTIEVQKILASEDVIDAFVKRIGQLKMEAEASKVGWFLQAEFDKWLCDVFLNEKYTYTELYAKFEDYQKEQADLLREEELKEDELKLYDLYQAEDAIKTDKQE
jgi:hypothetical protein